MQPKKILYIVDSYTNPYAGTEGQLFKLISNLDRDKFAPHLLLFNSSDYVNENGFPCEVTVLGASKLSSFFTWYALFRCLKQKKQDGFALAHIFFNDPSIIAPPLLKVLGYKTIISRRDMGYWYTPAYLAILRLNAKLVDAAIVNSKAVKNITCDKEWINPAKVHVIYNGYDALEVSQNAAVAKHNLDALSCEKVSAKDSEIESCITLGIVANIRPIKRMQDAIEATARLHEQGFRVRLVIVGGGEPDSLTVLADKLGIKHKVLFVGSQKDTSSYIQNFDVCLLCSESEGFSNAIIEYMQHGKPVVCSEVGGNPEILESGKNGYLYPMGNVDELVDCLRLLCESIERRESLGKQAEEKVSRLYGVGNMLVQHHTAYTQLLA